VAGRGGRFVELDVARRDDVLRQVEAGNAVAELQPFFERLRLHAMEGLFGDPSWGGNRDGAGWDLIGYVGPRKVWGYHEQQLDVVPNDEVPAASGER
jgi:gluconate 2-dehydrogenase gamma chain